MSNIIKLTTSNASRESRLGKKKKFVNWLKTMTNPKGRLGRKGFILVFICAFLSVLGFALIATLLWLLFDNTPHWIVNFGLVFLVLDGWLCLISGIVPLSVLLLCTFAIDTFFYGPDIGFVFFLETIMIAAFYAIYMIQCIRRCHDLGRKWWFCLIPFYNPFVLLFGKTKGKQNNVSDIG